VDDRSRVLAATVLGAVAGGALGYLYLTDSGRRLRSQIEPKLDDFMRELSSVRGTVEKHVRQPMKGGVRLTTSREAAEHTAAGRPEPRGDPWWI